VNVNSRDRQLQPLKRENDQFHLSVLICEWLLIHEFKKKLHIAMPKKVNIKSQHDLSSRLYELHMQRKHGKLKLPRKSPLTKNQRQIVLDKTGSKCHVCGDVLTIDKFQADHVKPHCSGVSSDAENYLPSCATCNNYRWHYLPEE